MVHRNSANITCTFRIYVCLRLCDRDCCSAADGSGSCHEPASLYFEEMTRCRRQKTSLEMTRQPSRSIEIPQFRFVYVYTIATDAPAAASRMTAASGDRSNGTLPTSKTSPAMIRIDRNSANTQIYAYEIKQSVSKNFF